MKPKTPSPRKLLKLLKLANLAIARQIKRSNNLSKEVSRLNLMLTEKGKEASSLRIRLNRMAIPVSAIYCSGKSQPVLLKDLMKIIKWDKENGKIVDGVLISRNDVLPVAQRREIAEYMMLDGVKVLRSSAIRDGFGLVVSRFRVSEHQLHQSYSLGRRFGCDDVTKD